MAHIAGSVKLKFVNIARTVHTVPKLMQVCFIKTTNLDGESNLKIRRPVDLKGDAPDNIAEVCPPSVFLPACMSASQVVQHVCVC